LGASDAARPLSPAPAPLLVLAGPYRVLRGLRCSSLRASVSEDFSGRTPAPEALEAVFARLAARDEGGPTRGARIPALEPTLCRLPGGGSPDGRRTPSDVSPAARPIHGPVGC